MRRSTENDKITNKIELEAKMIDDRSIQAHEFLCDDDFIGTKVFKIFFFQLKQNELNLQLQPGD